MPVLEAAHIRPFSMEGPKRIRNGLLLRSDFHTLFDRGYITIDPSLHVEVSHRLKEDFHNGKEYYAYQGKTLQTLPLRREDRPSANGIMKMYFWDKGVNHVQYKAFAGNSDKL